MKWLVFVFVFLSVFSCTTKNEKKERSYHAVGKYLYVDDVSSNVLHVDKECGGIGSDIQFIDTAVIYDEGQKFCQYCFCDSTYEHVQTILHRDHNLKWLYDMLTDNNYKMEPYREYIKNVRNIEKRKRLYDIAIDKKWVSGSFEEFTQMLEVE
jgi:hypothetical protein